jgi:glucose repression regulatory protein TUP1
LTNEDSGKDAGVTSIAIFENLIVTGSLDDLIRVWDMNGNLLEKFVGHGKSVYSVGFSNNGNEVVSGSLDQTVRVWELSPETIAANAAINSAGGPATSPSQQPPKLPTKTTTNSKSICKGHQDYVLTVGYPGRTSALGNVDKAGNALEPLNTDWVVSGGKDRHVFFWDKEDVVMSMSGHKNSGKI